MAKTCPERFHGGDLRKGRVSESGRIYLVTAVTRNRAQIFSDLSHARVLIKTMRTEELRQRVRTLAFVIMPDHLHWLLELGEGPTLSMVVGTVKAVTAHRLGQRCWQSGSYDHAICRDEDLVRLTRYIIADPLCAGLVTRISDYPHWHAVWL